MSAMGTVMSYATGKKARTAKVAKEFANVAEE
jgi:hypothetical protein